MPNNYVGAGILSIITESLYDNPIVVFREYVQNSVDSIFKDTVQDNYEIKIWNETNNLFFLDNGRGINKDAFHNEMKKIGSSTKKKQRNLGYKGIGRLSGVPYCKKVSFINIYDFSENKAQLYTIDSDSYAEIKDNDLSFSELMDKIGNYEDNINFGTYEIVSSAIKRHENILNKTNTGFLVILQDISSVLENAIKSNDFFINLQWLLPVNFDAELYQSEEQELFNDLTGGQHNDVIPVRYCKISYNDRPIFRPIKKDMFRDYICKNDFKYAVGFHSFKGDKIFINKNNAFSGIRVYIDNMLLCDENELLQNLDNYGMLDHTLNGQIQSVRGIGAMIYITDKINISTNARRTFIEVTDNESLEFLKLLAEFVNTIYDTRYALSNYASAKMKHEDDNQVLLDLKENALDNLRKLAKEEIVLTVDDESEQNFCNMSTSERKRLLKKRIGYKIDQKIKTYIKLVDPYNLETAYEDFIDWLNKQV